jgi:hypothetical protein
MTVAYQETTKFKDGVGGNHTYLFATAIKGRQATAVAYIPKGRTEVVRLKTPLKLDLKGRTFVQVNTN